MDDMQAIEQRIAGEMLRRAGASLPVDDAAIFTAITATQSPKWRFQSMFSATKFVVAGVIVALFGGFLLIAQPFDQQGGSLPGAATDTATQGEAATAVTGHWLDSGYWQPPTGPEQLPLLDGMTGRTRGGEWTRGRMEMSDTRLSGDVTYTHNVDIWASSGVSDGEAYLFWGTLLIENDGGTWEGTHLAADHHAQPGMHGPIVMQLVGSGDYEGLSAILYRTVVSEPPLEESVDGIIFPGDLPPSDRR